MLTFERTNFCYLLKENVQKNKYVCYLSYNTRYFINISFNIFQQSYINIRSAHHNDSKKSYKKNKKIKNCNFLLGISTWYQQKIRKSIYLKFWKKKCAFCVHILYLLWVIFDIIWIMFKRLRSAHTAECVLSTSKNNKNSKNSKNSKFYFYIYRVPVVQKYLKVHNYLYKVYLSYLNYYY